MNESDRNTRTKTEFVLNLTFLLCCAWKFTGSVTWHVNYISNHMSARAGFWLLELHPQRAHLYPRRQVKDLDLIMYTSHIVWDCTDLQHWREPSKELKLNIHLEQAVKKLGFFLFWVKNDNKVIKYAQHNTSLPSESILCLIIKQYCSLQCIPPRGWSMRTEL